MTTKVTIKELQEEHRRRIDSLVPKKKDKPDIRQIPPMTVDEDAYLVREMDAAPWRRMTRKEIEEQYPGAFDT